MKNILLIASLFAAALATGCSPSAKTSATPTPGTAAEQLPNAGTLTKDAAVPAQDFAFAQRAEFVAMRQNQLDALNLSVDEFSARIEASSAAVKVEATPKLAALRAQAASMKKQIAHAADATSSTWSAFKVESEKTYMLFKDGVAASRQWLSDKSAS